MNNIKYIRIDFGYLSDIEISNLLEDQLRYYSHSDETIEVENMKQKILDLEKTISKQDTKINDLEEDLQRMTQDFDDLITNAEGLEDD